jgi:hypothetical protein
MPFASVRHYAYFKKATQCYSTEFWTSLTKVFPLVKKATSQITRISKQWEVVTSWHTGLETEQKQDKYGFSSWYKNSKYDKVHIGVPAKVLLGLDNQRHFKTRETFVNTYIVGIKGYKWNSKSYLFRKLTFHNMALRYWPKERGDIRRPIRRTD